MKQTLLFAISLFFFSPFCFTQTVWPGDVNNNGIVNEVDLLYLGLAFNAIGSPRTTTTNEWIGQDLTTAWEGTFPNGLNFAFADCNGDGIVDLNDAAVIESNFTLSHADVPFIPDEIVAAVQGTDPKFSFAAPIITVTPNVREEVRISLSGEEGLTISNILGISFHLNLGPDFFQTDRSRFEFSNVTWLSPFGEETTDLIVKNEDNGKIKVAITKTDQIPASGAGLVGTVSFVIIEDAVDLLMQDDTLSIEIDSVTVFTDDFEQIPVLGATAILEVEGRSTSTYNPILDKIKLYPNPTSGWVLLKTNDIAIEKVEVVNALGQIIYQESLNKNAFHSLDLQAIPAGIHWLRMITEYGTRSTKIQKL